MNTNYLSADFYQSESINEIIPALIQFQTLFANVSLKKDAKNDFIGNKYLTLDNLLYVIRPLLNECELVIVQQLSGQYLTTVLYHVNGQFIGSNMPFNPMENSKANAVQELGGGMSYARRYSLSALLQISVDIDSDANGSKITKDQLTKKEKKKVETVEQLNKLVDWILQDLSRRKTVKDSYELTQSQMDFIEYELQTRV